MTSRAAARIRACEPQLVKTLGQNRSASLADSNPFSVCNKRLGGERQYHVRHPANIRTEEARRHHAYDRERNALHGEPAPDDVAGASEALPPEAMTDHGDGAVRRGAAIVGGRDHPAPYGCDAEHVEEAAAEARRAGWPAQARRGCRSWCA